MGAAVALDGYFKVDKGSNSLAALAYCDSASVSFTNNLEDITGLGSKWHEYVSTLRGWSGNANLTLDISDPAQLAMWTLMKSSDRIPGVQAELALGSGLKIAGTVILSNFNLSAAVNGVVKVSMSYTGTGAPSDGAV